MVGSTLNVDLEVMILEFALNRIKGPRLLNLFQEESTASQQQPSPLGQSTMQMIPRKPVKTVMNTLIFCVLLSCGGGGVKPSENPTQSTSLILSPRLAELGPGSTFQFSTAGSTNIGPVTWSVAPAGQGSISQEGLYTAPLADGSYQVTAASSGKSVSATVTVYHQPYAGSLAFSPQGIRRGASSSTTLQFGFGTGVLDPGGLPVISGNTYSVSPLVNTAYTLTVSNLQGVVRTSGGFVQVWDQGAHLPTGQLITPRAGHTATLLNSGKVLITGGYTPRQNNGDGYLDTAELYDPATKTFSAISSRMSVGRSGHSATLLKNGKVLIAGGWSNYAIFTDSADLYDPSTNTFAATGHMNIGRTNHGSLLLPDGRTLLAGGLGETLSGSVSMEIYDPNQETFQPTIGMRYQRSTAMLFLRPDGTVLILGGTNWIVNGEVYDPASNTSTFLTQELPIMWGAIPIPGGRVFSYNYPQAQIVDLSTFSVMTFTGSSVSAAPGTPVLACMPNGKVLICGGYPGSQGGTFDLNKQGFNQVGPILYPRTSHTATPLADGTILIAGGQQFDFNGTCISNCELFDSTKPNAGP